MIKTVLSFLLLFAAPILTSGQASTFLKTYNKGNSGYSVREVNGNSYVVAGGTDYYYNYHWMQMSSFASTNIHLYKTGNTGILIWEKIIGNINSRTLATWMEPVSAGGFIITGHDNKDVSWPPDSNDIILIKTDGNGTVSWSKIIDSGKDELGYCVRETFDGGFIVSGFHDAMPVSLLGNTYALLVKTDANGNISWSKKYQVAVRDFDTGESFPSVVRQTADSGYVLTGTTSGIHQADIFILRTDASGNLLWCKSYEHDPSMMRLSCGLDIIETATGGFVVAASLDKDRILMQFNHPCILKTDAGGTLINARLYDSNPIQQFQSGFSSVEAVAGGGYFFTGMGGYGGSGTQAQLLKTDNNFNMTWSRSYTWDGLATMGSRSGRSTSDGGYIFAGKKQFAGSVLMKTDFSGLIPCKNPGTLNELIPSFVMVNRTPAVLSGINSNVFPVNTQPALVDTGTLCPVTPGTLPVSIISLSAQRQSDGSAIIRWTTAAEYNNAMFKIEKSMDGLYFFQKGMVPGYGNSRTSHDYSFTDYFEGPENKIYYRLQQVDFDGRSENTRMVAVEATDFFSGKISITQEAVADGINIYVRNVPPGQFTYMLNDITGKKTAAGLVEMLPGTTVIKLSTVNFTSGIYFLNLISNSGSYTGKICF